MCLCPRFIRYFVNHPAKLQIELDRLLMKHRDVLVIAFDGLYVQAAIFILARIERQEIPPFAARDEHVALNLRLVFLRHSFEPGADVDGLIEWALRLNAAVLANQTVPASSPAAGTLSPFVARCWEACSQSIGRSMARPVKLDCASVPVSSSNSHCLPSRP
jgi:hypothetical protein